MDSCLVEFCGFLAEFYGFLIEGNDFFRREDAPFLWHFSQPRVLQLEKILVEVGFMPMVIH
jgi:hypothetical protein